MIRLSANVLCLILKLLKRIDSGLYSDKYDIFAQYSIQTKDIAQIASKCKWIQRDNNHSLCLTDEGKEILIKERLSESLAYRLILRDYIKFLKPTWRSRIPFGREETLILLTKDEHMCFFEAKLMDMPPSLDTIKWWDKVATEIRNEQKDTNSIIGRIGENLTMMYEFKRTGKQPIWKSVDSNLLGYDILSHVSKTNISKLPIEVKTSEQSIDYSYFFITKNEWNIAKMSNYYCFHLWMVYNNQKRLAIIKPQQIAKYIPTNNDVGEWESVRIPFSEFKELFTTVNNNMEVVNEQF